MDFGRHLLQFGTTSQCLNAFDIFLVLVNSKQAVRYDFQVSFSFRTDPAARDPDGSILDKKQLWPVILAPLWVHQGTTLEEVWKFGRVPPTPGWAEIRSLS